MEINKLEVRFQASAKVNFKSSLFWEARLTLQDGSHRLYPEVDNQLSICAAQNPRTAKANKTEI